MSNVVPINGGYPGHPLRALNQFTAEADLIVDRHERLRNLPAIVSRKMETMKSGDIDQLFAEAKRAAVLGELYETILARCEAALERFDPESNYEHGDNTGNLKRSVTGGRLAILVGAFPNGSPADPAVYVQTLVEAVAAVELSLPALDASFWEVVGTMKFLPAPSEVVEIVNRQQDAWSERFAAIQDLADQSRRTVARIEALERRRNQK